MDSKSTGASSKGQGKASANSPSPSFKVSANADGVPRGGKVNAKAAVSADSAPPQLLAEVPNLDGGGGGGYGMAARLPHQQSGSFPHGNGS